MTAPGLDCHPSFWTASSQSSPVSGPKLLSFRSRAAQTVCTMIVARLLPATVTDGLDVLVMIATVTVHTAVGKSIATQQEGEDGERLW